MPTFIQSDLGLLSKHYEVRSLDVGKYEGSFKGEMIVAYRLLRGVLWSDVVFSWFADRHTRGAVRLSRMFGKPSVVVVGGYEVAKMPEIGYGSMLDPKKAKTVRYVLKSATKVLAVSGFSQEQIRAVSDADNVELVYNGVDTGTFIPSASKSDLVLTVGLVNRNTVPLKGFRTFIACAARFPDVRFVVVGLCPDNAVDELKAVAPKNVEFTGLLPQGELREIFAKAKVYCQLSMHESFGMSTVEAMSSGCIPVVTRAGALPEVVGDTGIFVPYGDVEATTKAIHEALKRTDGDKVRERAKKLFSIDIREREFVRIIEGLNPVKPS